MPILDGKYCLFLDKYIWSNRLTIIPTLQMVNSNNLTIDLAKNKIKWTIALLLKTPIDT